MNANNGALNYQDAITTVTVPKIITNAGGKKQQWAVKEKEIPGQHLTTISILLVSGIESQNIIK